MTGVALQLTEELREDITMMIDNRFQFFVDNEDQEMIDDIYPMTEVDDWDLVVGLMDYVMPIASVIGVDGAIPEGRANIDFTTYASDYAKLGQMHLWNESRLRHLARVLRGSSNQAILETALQTLFLNPQQQLIDNIVGLGRMLSIKQLFYLNIDYADPATGARVELDFRSLAPTSLWPAPLTGGDRWDQYATANGLRDLQNHMEAYYDINHRYPEEIRMHWSLCYHLVQQDAVINFVNSGLTSADVAISTPTLELQRLEQLNNILGRTPLRNGQRFPRIVTFDRKFPVLITQAETSNQTTDAVPTSRLEYVEAVPLDRYCFVSRINRPIINSDGGLENRDLMGVQVYGPTIESAINQPGQTEYNLQQVMTDLQSGPFVWSEKISSSAFAAKAVANMVPFPAQPRLFGGRQVI